MPPNKRNKGFSPYTYTVQYARPGAGPVQAARPYVNMAIQGEDHYVVSKKDPEWFVYATNVFNYNLSDDCELIFEKATTTLQVVHKSVKLKNNDSMPLTQVELKTAGMTFNVRPASSYNHQWTKLNELKIAHTLGQFVDCIVIGDSQYINCRKKFQSNETMLVFDDNFKFNTFGSLCVIMYQISGDMSKFSASEISNPASFDYSVTTRLVSFENLFNGTDCIPLIFDINGYSYSTNSIDLLPNRVIVSADDVGVLNADELNTEMNNVNAELDAIQAAYPDSQDLYQQNADFRRLTDKLAWIENALLSVSSEYAMNIMKAIEYSFDECAKATIQYGVNRPNVAWNENTAIVTHNLGGYVNFVLDGSIDYASGDIDRFKTCI